MIYTSLKLAHVLATIVWIGGMVFAHFFLRPAVMSLEVPERVRLCLLYTSPSPRD